MTASCSQSDLWAINLERFSWKAPSFRDDWNQPAGYFTFGFVNVNEQEEQKLDVCFSGCAVHSLNNILDTVYLECLLIVIPNPQSGNDGLLLWRTVWCALILCTSGCAGKLDQQQKQNTKKLFCRLQLVVLKILPLALLSSKQCIITKDHLFCLGKTYLGCFRHLTQGLFFNTDIGNIRYYCALTHCG